jgi:hypothetical protein
MQADRIRPGEEAQATDETGRPTTQAPDLKRPIVYDFEATLAHLQQSGYNCNGYELDLEFGQPFRTLEEAQLYYMIFRTRSYPGGISLPELEQLLQHRPGDRYPWYLPITRHLAIFHCQQ